jgi:hypothetical protein
VVKALRYKLEGRGFGNRRSEVFSIYLILPAALGPGVTQNLTEMSTRSRKRMYLGSRARPACRADSLTAICEPIV